MSSRTPTPEPQPQQQYPGDDILPDAQIIHDQKRTIKAPASEIFPWLRQLGKGRGGWYLPSKFEKILPPNLRASRVIDERWQGMVEGDKIPDYGFSKHDYFLVKKVEINRSIVFLSSRGGFVYTWALLLQELNGSDPEPETLVHLRLRGRVQATGWKQKALVKGGEVLDAAAAAPLLSGIADRCEKKVERPAAKLEKAEKRRSG
ncbi:uncharacterized protein MYCFIDRAFT_61870 [Pseudocercospora fijiensis CIRAD86]|uniref:Uncharacterized protein n=1 Tax=Pseudocercospora fijiensis (strain CIRAD86) TaxID=383855 RepID=M3ATJ3_PSEFD|nr:uncharacterized protein MYCFIDRAFT_61870 [Pseudocercospora fijiensis CIRAD86]EME80777.1 hypothetical protein MYCFIDRAFT_61870 [Pseudocercospora fijiensis CIRAD86]